MTTGPSGGSSNVAQACAACKHQRRKCAPDCVLAPFFPPHRQAEFLNVHRLFGVRNIMNTVKKVEVSRRGDAVRSMVQEAYLRAVDPAGGAYRILTNLQQRYGQMRAELHLVQQHLAIFRSIQIDGMDEQMQHPLAGDIFDQQQSMQAANQKSNLVVSPRNNILPSDIDSKEGLSSNDKKALQVIISRGKKRSSSELEEKETFELTSYNSNVGNTKNITKNNSSSSRREEKETSSPKDIKPSRLIS